jgi:hypothetical protein
MKRLCWGEDKTVCFAQSLKSDCWNFHRIYLPNTLMDPAEIIKLSVNPTLTYTYLEYKNNILTSQYMYNTVRTYIHTVIR